MALRPRFPVPPLPARRPWLAQTFTGRLIVRLESSIVDRVLREGPERRALTLSEVGTFTSSALIDLLKDLGNPRTARLIHRWTLEETNQREQNVRATGLVSFRSLNSYFSVDLSGRTLPQLVNAAGRFNRLTEVDTAFVEPLIVPASVTPDLYTHQKGFIKGQGYVFGVHAKNSRMSGINADAVWGSYDGAGVNVVILEEGWKFDHPDLPHPGGLPLDLLDAAMVNVEAGRDHGTSSLGVIAAVDHPADGDGIVGIAPAVTIPGLASFKYAGTDWEVVDAIAAAIDVLGAGDVLLLEVQTISTVIVNGVTLPDGYPIEIVDHWLDVIRLAALHQITVVEAAGNPDANSLSFDLDKAKWTPIGGQPRSLDRSDPTFIDSGAIMVGACKSIPLANDLHDRMPDAWFGSRIDCYAWGEEVLTTSCIGMDFSDNFNTKSTCQDGAAALPTYAYFGYTSAASAVITGAVALIHQMHRDVLGTTASPARIRQIVRDPALGTKIGDTGTNLCAMPDLAKVAGVLSALPDIFVRDSLTDVGAEPSPVVSMSPDVFVLNTQLVLPDPGPPWNDWSQFVHNDLVIPGADNYVYVRISNLSPATAAVGCNAFLYWAPPTSLLMPIDWRLIGTLPASVNVPAGGHVLAGPVVWRPTIAELPPGGHGCFIAQLDHPTDPRPIPAPDTVTWDEFRAFIGNSNNVAWRNFNAVAGLPANSIPSNPAADWHGADFDMRGAPGQPERFDFAILHSGLPAGTRLFWRMPAHALRLFRDLSGGAADVTARTDHDQVVVELPSDRPLHLHDVGLPADARIPMSFGVFSPDGRLARPGRLEIRQFHERTEMGRITWEFAPVER